MIKIEDLDIKINGFHIMQINNHAELTTGITDYYPSPTDGGLKIQPKLSISNVENGIFYISQICNKHHLIIKSNNKTFSFKPKEKLFDSPSNNFYHFNWYRIKSNKIMDKCASIYEKVDFFDAPFAELLGWWDSFYYQIEFETFFQYSKNSELNKDIKPLLSLKWYLEAECLNDGVSWNIIKENYSSVKEIKKSVVKLYNDKVSPFIPDTLQNLFYSLKAFKENHKELRTDFKGKKC